MTALLIGVLAFVVSIGGAIGGTILGRQLPEHHRTKDTKDLISVSVAVVATLAALVAGLLTSAAKASFDARDLEIKQAAARLVMLDHALVAYGPQAREARTMLRRLVEQAIEAVWSENRVNLDRHARGMEPLLKVLYLLPAEDEIPKYQKTRALQLAAEIENLRLDILQRKDGSIPHAFVAVLIFWFAIIFLSFGLFAPRNASAYVVLTTSALCVATALYLIVQMDRPYSGFIQLSKAPLTSALADMDRQED